MKKRTAWLWVLLGVTLGACGESVEPLALKVEPEPEVPSVDLLALIDCSVEVSSGTMTCAPSEPTLPEGASGIIVGSQGENVLLTSDNVGFKADSSIFHADVTVQNLIGQALGTTDGVTAHPAGLRIFYVELPAATGETGPAIDVLDAEFGTFTGTDQPYYEYDGLLEPNETSEVVTWRWSIPEGVEEFDFSVAVSAEVQYPNGWIETPSGAEFLLGTVGGSALIDVQGRDV